ncbi:hypothetical protein [Spirillospora sp. NPDC047279]|uniref:SecDF P1 head subdomain-containing protein n=1 Tax=Spirillospora sp. NPDC047279 TaxID=3155478 RepID=UPI003400D11D
MTENQPWPPTAQAAHGERKGPNSALVALAIILSIALLGAVGVAVFRLLDSGSAKDRPFSGRLRTPMELRPVTAERPAPCQAGQVAGQDGRTCYGLGAGFTVTTVKSLEMLPPDPAKSRTRPTLSVRLQEQDGRRFTEMAATAAAAYTRDPTAPGGKIAVVVKGQVVMAPQITTPITGAGFEINPGESTDAARALLESLTGE